MSTLKDDSAAAEEQPSSKKRRRLEEETPHNTASHLDCLSDDLLLLVLKFLPADDLNEFAVCSKRCRDIRSHSDLDQTRSGTLTFRKGARTATTFVDLIDRMRDERWDAVFQGNRTNLRVEGVENIGMISDIESSETRLRIHTRDIHLAGVTCLDLSYHPTGPENIWIGSLFFGAYAPLFPNLLKLDLSCRSTDANAVNVLINQRPRLSRFTWLLDGAIDLCGHLFRDCESLHELYIQNGCLGLVGDVDSFSQEPTNGRNNVWLLMECSARLERLDIKGTVLNIASSGETNPIPDEIIMKFVRHTRTLRWLRSDLSAANVALLKRERPDVTFVCK